MTCPDCQKEMQEGAIYVRGIGAALFWSSRKDIRFLSKRDLEQIDLNQISITPTGGQAVIEGWRCGSCRMITFKADAGK